MLTIVLGIVGAILPPAVAFAVEDPGGGGGSSCPTGSQVRTVTDTYLFSYSMTQFQNLRNVARCSSVLDWSSDGCSSPLGNQPDGFNFLPSCQRHDFGYRNYKRQGRFTESNRARIDGQFKTDMYNYCAQFSGWQSAAGVLCRRDADLYYNAVRLFGS